MAINYALPFAQSPNPGLQLGDALSMFNAIGSFNGITRAYNIKATGDSRESAFPLTCVLNEVTEIRSGAEGIALPSSRGTSKVPYAFCIIVNSNTDDGFTLYSAAGTSDIINNRGSSFLFDPLTLAMCVSTSPGNWWVVTTTIGS